MKTSSPLPSLNINFKGSHQPNLMIFFAKTHLVGSLMVSSNVSMSIVSWQDLVVQGDGVVSGAVLVGINETSGEVRQFSFHLKGG